MKAVHALQNGGLQLVFLCGSGTPDFSKDIDLLPFDTPTVSSTSARSDESGASPGLRLSLAAHHADTQIVGVISDALQVAERLHEYDIGLCGAHPMIQSLDVCPACCPV